MDSDESLREALVGEVCEIKDEYVYQDLGRAFQHWAAVNILGLEDGDISDGLKGSLGNDGGIDYFNRNEDARTFEIVQAKFSKDLDAEVGPDTIREFFDVPGKLKNGSSSPNSSFERQRDIYKEYTNLGYETRLILVVAGEMSASVKELINEKNRLLPDNIRFDCLEIKDLLALVGNPVTPTWTLRLLEGEGFASKEDGGRLRCMAGTVPASELKRLYDAVGAPVLFSENPRMNLGSPISKDIKKTLEERPDRLWHYNNGVSAVCKDFKYDRWDNTVTIDNLKVVNGCQTISAIGKHGLDIDDRASLLFRLSKADSDEFRENISEFTNNQNRIVKSDLISNTKELVLLEQRFEKYRPFFWERKRGMAEGKVQGKKPLYVIKNVNAARLKMAYSMGRPNMSIRLSQAKLFSDDPDLQPLRSLYADADPRDFIVPHLFAYWLKEVKKRLKANADDEDGMNAMTLATYGIGHYYTVAVIGRIFGSEDHGVRERLVDSVINAASNGDADATKNIVEELGNLVKWIAAVIPAVLGSPKTPLRDYTSYELRDSLSRDNKLDEIYAERKKNVKLALGYDPFVARLRAILGC